MSPVGLIGKNNGMMKELLLQMRDVEAHMRSEAQHAQMRSEMQLLIQEMGRLSGIVAQPT